MKNGNNHINRLTPELMLKYERGELSAREMHAVEKLLLESEFESEAMEGLHAAGPEAFRQGLDVLHRRLQDRTQPHTTHSTSPAGWWWMAAAAVVLLMVTGIFIYAPFGVNEPPLAESGSAPADERIARSEPEDNDGADTMVIPEEETTIEQTEDNAPDITANRREENDQIAMADTDPDVNLESREEREENLAAARSAQPNAVLPSQEQDTLQRAKQGFAAVERKPVETADVPLPEAEISAPEQELMGVIRGEDFDMISATAGRPLELVHGKVIDRSGRPVAGANIMVKGSTRGYVSDSNGEFELDLENIEEERIIVSFIGMKSREFILPQADSLTIVLEEDNAALSEVVVTAADEAPAHNIIYRGALPDGGLDNFEAYIDANIRPPSADSVDTDVIVIFTVSNDGSLSDFRVRRSPGEEYTQEAIRLIRQGPVWRPALQDGMPVRDRVRVKIHFK